MKAQRLRVTFARGDLLRYITHLDLMRSWERAIKRAGLPISYSEGFTRHPQLALAAPLPVGATAEGEAPPGGGPVENTVIGCVVTNARLTKIDAVRVADLAHSGVARSVRPAHTSMDGDALFCLATQQVQVHLDLVAALAADAVAEACRRGPLAATSRDGIPGLAGDAPG